MGVVLVAALEDSQSLQAASLARALQAGHFPTIYGNVSFDDSRKGAMDYLVRQVSCSCEGANALHSEISLTSCPNWPWM